ncbi:MAG: PH domain-containing protein [Candidatus Moranbacteria bacterium]|nr:PH domain-containing protein [Candidatus Moranbacteria bacterium]
MTHHFNRYHFQGQHEGEQVLNIIHRHWFNILTHYLVVFGCAFLVFGSIGSFPILFPEAVTPANQAFFLFAQNTFLIFLWLYGFLVWVDYYFDVWIITSERIVNIEQRGLFIRHISELRFSRVQDVTSSVSGLLPTILNFGDVYVQTAAEEERFVFRQVGDPFAIKSEVMRLSRVASQENMRDLANALEKE